MGNLQYCPNTEHVRFCAYHQCPHMFKCKNTYCIYVHKVCDGVNDCPDNEDEIDCKNFICPGLLKCSMDYICVHPLHICDNIIHCRLSRDDESACHILQKTCPFNCKCVGYTVECFGSMISVDIIEISTLFKVVTLTSVNIPEYINSVYFNDIFVLRIFNEYVNLTKFQLHHLKFLTMYNIRQSRLPSYSFSTFSGLQNLSFHKCIIESIEKHSFYILNRLQLLDLSRIRLKYLKRAAFFNMFLVSVILLNNNNIRTIPLGLFKDMISLTSINLQENQLYDLKDDVFSRYIPLSLILKTDYKELCCHMFNTNVQCLPSVLNKRDIVCKNIIINITLSYIAGFVNIIILFITLTIIPLKLRKFRHKYIYIVYCILFISNVIGACYMLVILVQDRFHHEKYNILQNIWSESFFCKALSLILTLSIAISNFSSGLLSLNAWLLIKYPLKRQGLTKNQILLGTLTYVLIAASMNTALILESPLPIQCFIIIPSQTSVFIQIVYFISQTCIVVPSLGSCYFASNIILVAKKALSGNISMSVSQQRKRIYGILIRNFEVKLLFQLILLSVYGILIGGNFVLRSDITLVLLMVYTFSLWMNNVTINILIAL